MRRRPPCPDPERYIWIESKTGGYWRKRPSYVLLNTAMEASAALMSRVSPVNRKIRQALHLYLQDLETGRLGNRLNVAARNSLREHDVLQMSAYKGIEFQERYFLEKLLLPGWKVITDASGWCRVKINILPEGSITKHNNLVTHYRFCLILLSAEGRKSSDFMTAVCYSPSYRFRETASTCLLEMPLPKGKRPWLLCLRAETFEGTQPSSHPKGRAMRVVAAGGEMKV